ncbi:MAG TPA: sugar-binding domain-containing protein, partial [Dehalococcoidales bacterium]
PRNNISYTTGPVSIDPKSNQPMGQVANLDMAVIGLGQLNTQHHYLRDHNELQLKAMSEPIRKIISWQAEHPELLDSVAEIVLRLYPVGAKSLSQEFLDIIEETNKTILAAPVEKIKNAGEIVLIAGGRQKLNAIKGILTGKCANAPVDKRNLTLVTDSWTAQTILHLP